MRVVDFGCGTGSITLGVATKVAPGEVLGFDMSETAIAQARTQAELSGVTNVRFSAANIYELELPAVSFDVAYFSNLLAHLGQPQKAVELAYRALKPGGVIAARERQAEGDWVAGPPREALAQLNAWGTEDWKTAGGDPFLGRRLGTLLREAGFVSIDVRPSCVSILSTRQAVPSMARRVFSEPDFKSRVLRRGVAPEQLQQMFEAVALWGASEDSVAGFAECTAIGFKK